MFNKHESHPLFNPGKTDFNKRNSSPHELISGFTGWPVLSKVLFYDSGKTNVIEQKGH